MRSQNPSSVTVQCVGFPHHIILVSGREGWSMSENSSHSKFVNVHWYFLKITVTKKREEADEWAPKWGDQLPIWRTFQRWWECCLSEAALLLMLKNPTHITLFLWIMSHPFYCISGKGKFFFSLSSSVLSLVFCKLNWQKTRYIGERAYRFYLILIYFIGTWQGASQKRSESPQREIRPESWSTTILTKSDRLWRCDKTMRKEIWASKSG